MRRVVLAVTIAALNSPTGAVTGGADAREPVNVITESGLDVGPCDGGGALSYPPAPYKGSAYFLRKVDAMLAARHEDLTKRQAPWLYRLDGPSGNNRLYIAANGDRAIVFWSCRAGDCAANIAYGAYGLAANEYALQVRQDGKSESLGSASATLAAAIACARSNDDRIRGRAAEQLKKQTGK